MGRLRLLARVGKQTHIVTALPAIWSMLATSLVTACVLWYGSAQVLAAQMTISSPMCCSAWSAWKK